MKVLPTLLAGGLCLLASCGTSGPVVTSSEVIVSTDDIEYTLDLGTPFSNAFMIFGGLASDRSDMLSKVTIAGLPMDEARDIYDRYPDFHECKSNGAPLAQEATQSLHFVPRTDEVFDVLSEALAAHEESLSAKGGRVSVRVTGKRMELSSATVEGQEVLPSLLPAVPTEYVLVESAEIVDTKSTLEGR